MMKLQLILINESVESEMYYSYKTFTLPEDEPGTEYFKRVVHYMEFVEALQQSEGKGWIRMCSDKESEKMLNTTKQRIFTFVMDSIAGAIIGYGLLSLYVWVTQWAGAQCLPLFLC